MSAPQPPESGQPQGTVTGSGTPAGPQPQGGPQVEYRQVLAAGLPRGHYSNMHHGLDETGLADRFTDWFGDDFRYDRKRKTWRRWLPPERFPQMQAGTHWPEVTADDVTAVMLEVVRRMAELEAPCGEEDHQEAIEKFAASCRAKISKVEAAVRILRAKPELWVSEGQLDQHPFKVNFANCTYDMMTGSKCAHDRADLLTYCMDYGYIDKTPETAPGRWLGLLWRMSGQDESLFHFNLQADSLAMIAGNPGERFYLRLGGSNMGKSKKDNTITGTVIPRGRWYPAQPSLIGRDADGPGYRHSSLHNTLGGSSWVTLDDIGASLAIDDNLLNQLTSEGSMATTQLFAARQQIPKITWTIMANANDDDLPRIASGKADSGLERHICVIPVPEYDGAELVPGIHRQILAEEGAAIASTLARAAGHVLRSGMMAPPPAVVTATDDYLCSQDPRRRWVRDRLEAAPGQRLRSTEAYQACCQETGLAAGSHTAFTRYLTGQGFATVKSMGVMWIDNARWKRQGE